MRSNIAILVLALGVAIAGAAQAQEPAVPEVAPMAAPEIFAWRIQPQVGQKFDFRTFQRVDVLSEKPAMRDGFFSEKGSSKPKHYTARSRNVFLTKSHFRLDVISATPNEWAARFTFLDSSFAVLRDGEVGKDSFLGPRDKPAVEAKHALARQQALLRESNRISHALQGAQVTAVISSTGKFLRWQGFSKWKESRQKAWRQPAGGAIDIGEYLPPTIQGEQTFKDLLISWLAGVPAKPVTVGEEWNYDTVPLGSSIPGFKVQGKRVLKSVSDGIAAIADDVPLDFSPPMPEPRADTTLFGLICNGKSQGTMQVNTGTGLPSRLQRLATMKLKWTVQTGLDPVQLLQTSDLVTQDTIVCEPLPKSGQP